jgi:CAAX protease family protein
MKPLAAVLATALAAMMIGLQPFAGRRRYRRLLAAIPGDPTARIRHYRRGITAEWLAVGFVLLIGVLAGRSASSVGLTTAGFGKETSEVVAGVVVLAATAVAFRAEALRDAIRAQARGFLALLPRTAEERWTFAALAVTAGICEEILFRGFGMAYARWIWPGASHPWLIVLTSVPFGLAHLYQGPRGVVLTGLLGAVMASLVLDSGSLLPAMLLHGLLDLRILALPDLQPTGSG